MGIFVRLGRATCITSVGVLLSTTEALPLERAVLALSGPSCRVSQQAIIQAIEGLEGVAQVNTDMIPDHVLIDHDGLHRTEEEWAGLLNNELTGKRGGCRAAVMKTCITADFGN